METKPMQPLNIPEGGWPKTRNAVGMPDWPHLWEREPALKPDGLGRTEGRRYEEWAGPPSEWFLSGSHFGKAMKVGIPQQYAAAMCRDAASLYLAKQGVWLHHSEHGWLCYQLVYSEPEPFGKWDFHATPDAALYAGCETVVNNRG